MLLINKEKLEALPLLKDLGNKIDGNTKVPLKIFNPLGAGTWFIIAVDEDEKIHNNETKQFHQMILYGVCCINEPELGRVSLNELEEIKLPFGIGLERDTSWDNEKTLKDVNEYLKQNGYGNIDFIAA